ncbi:MAG: M20/M25/M40 family metallo-hydrolase [Dehalococcoidia bacterium]
MPANPQIDWDALNEEAIDTLCRYIRVDTSNPPGNERAACTFLGEILTREGIPFELYDAGNDRVSLRAVLRGDGSARPFMLLHHTDVVPVQREYWEEEPFGGLIKDGYIWGRGALDTKGLGVAQLMTFLTLKRFNVPLTRDVVFYAMADEEAGGIWGVEWLDQHHPETLDVEYVINEGGGGITGNCSMSSGRCSPSPSPRRGRSGCGWWRRRATRPRLGAARGQRARPAGAGAVQDPDLAARPERVAAALGSTSPALNRAGAHR